MTPEQRESRIKKLVSSARALLSLQVGLAVGANRIINELTWLGPEFKDSYPVFRQFIGSIPASVPLGSARLEWNPEPLLKTDQVLANAERQYREAVLRACIEIINKYG